MKKTVIFGAGNIGRGFIGQLFSESGYEVVFIDINSELIDSINKSGQYNITVCHDEGYEELTVKNVRGINADDSSAVINELAGAEIAATAVGSGALPYIAKSIAEAILRREPERPLNILLCENLLNADSVMRGFVKKELGEANLGKLDCTGFIRASIGRMVPNISGENGSRIFVEEYSKLPVDKAAFIGKIPEIKNMTPYSPFDYFIEQKLYVFNIGHAMTAYLGRALYNYEYIYEAIANPNIRETVQDAMNGTAVALAEKYGRNQEEELEEVRGLLKRFGNRLLNDTVERVGRDVKRKLSPNDRLIGGLKLCKEYNINAEPVCMGIAAALRFSSLEEIYICSESEFEIKAEAILIDLCGLSFEKYSNEINKIKKYLYEFQRSQPPLVLEVQGMISD